MSSLYSLYAFNSLTGFEVGHPPVQLHIDALTALKYHMQIFCSLDNGNNGPTVGGGGSYDGFGSI
jgi:hypothetical protein